MADNVDNLVLEQLRPIRETLGQMLGEIRGMCSDFDEKIDGSSGKVLANTTVVMALAQYIGTMNERVEHIEAHLGIAT